MNRRRFLAVAGGGLSLAAGCTSRSSDPAGSTPDSSPSDATETPTVTPTDSGSTTAPSDGTTSPPGEDAGEAADVSVGDVAVQPDVVAMNYPDSVDVFGHRDERYVVASVTAADGAAPARDEFALELAGKTYAPTLSVGDHGMDYRFFDRGRAYAREDATGWLLFAVPAPVAAESPALAWPGGEHRLSEAAAARLSRPPTSFEVVEFAAPAAVEPGATATLSATVENTGDADGTFVLGLNRVGPRVAYAPVARAAVSVPAGETATWEYASDAGDRAEAGDDMQFHLEWRGGRESRTVEFE